MKKLTREGLDAVLSSTCDRGGDSKDPEVKYEVMPPLKESKVLPEYLMYATAVLAGQMSPTPEEKFDGDSMMADILSIICQSITFGVMWERSRQESEQMERSFYGGEEVPTTDRGRTVASGQANPSDGRGNTDFPFGQLDIQGGQKEGVSDSGKPQRLESPPFQADVQ